MRVKDWWLSALHVVLAGASVALLCWRLSW
jgi:hypothetical protein